MKNLSLNPDLITVQKSLDPDPISAKYLNLKPRIRITKTLFANSLTSKVHASY
jgi:hypothetical protein